MPTGRCGLEGGYLHVTYLFSPPFVNTPARFFLGRTGALGQGIARRLPLARRSGLQDFLDEGRVRPGFGSDHPVQPVELV